MKSRIQKLFEILSVSLNTNNVLKFPRKKACNDTQQKYIYTRVSEKNCCSENDTKVSDFFKYINKNYKDELGRSTWKLLHAMAESYPETPSISQQNDMNIFLAILAKNYPCDDCRNGFINLLKENKPKLNSRISFSRWVCAIHNSVNQKIGKNTVDCKKIYK